MCRFYDVTKRVVFLLLVGQAVLPSRPVVHGSPPTVAARMVDVSKISSIEAMSEWLEDLYAEGVQAKGRHRFSLESQEQTLKKAGESISKILELEKRANLASQKVGAAFRAAFERNEAILQLIIQSNEEVIEELQEEKLDKVGDTQGFLDSPEWQMPHRLISLSRYWLSWNRYYRSFLYPEGDPEARSLLREAIGGFSLTLFDIEDQAIVAKSLFGRALCFKEEKRYEKAVADLESITQHVRHNDPLYLWSLYEQALIAYRLGKYDEALANLEKLDTGLEAKIVTDVLGNEHQRLRERVILEPRVKALLENLGREVDKTGDRARKLAHEAHRGLKRLSRFEASHATTLYRLVADHPGLFSSFSYEDLEAIGNLAMADTRFQEGRYQEAEKRYRSLWTSQDFYIRKRMDDIYFRTGYANCQIGRWKDALSSFDELYAKYPGSKLTGKAVCLEYVAAAGRYKQNPGQLNHSRYVASAKRYLKECPNPRDKDGAHFLLGKDYHEKGEAREARKEFTAIAEDSPHYWPGMYYVVKADVEDLEVRKKRGTSGSSSAKKLYQNLQALFARYQRLAHDGRAPQGVAEVSPHMTLLQARFLRCAPEESCGKVIETLEGFEKLFPKNQTLWLKAMGLRLACYEKLKLIDASKEQILYLSREYPVDEGLWDFLGEWAEKTDEEEKGLRDKENLALADAYADLSLAIYTEMSAIASKQARYGQYLDTVQIRLAEILFTLGQTERAGQIYEEVLKRTPDSAEALYQLGRIYEGQHRWDAALGVWRRYSSGVEAGSQPWFESRYRIARAHSRMGRAGDACEVITMIRVLHPEIGNAQLEEKLLNLEQEVCKKGD